MRDRQIVLLVVLAVLVLPLGFKLSALGKDSDYLSYDDFIRAVEAGHIKAVTLDKFSSINGTQVVGGVEKPFHSYAETGGANDPLLLRFLANLVHPGISPGTLLLHPVGRAAWVGLFATSLNLLPVAQLDGGHILRSISSRLHRFLSSLLPLVLIVLAYFHFWEGWYIWGALLFGMSFLRVAPIFDPTPLNPHRRLGALFTLLIFLLCFMPAPFNFSPTSH